MVAPTCSPRPNRNPRLEQLPALRAQLQRLRAFREEQLAHLLAHERNHTSLRGYGPRAADQDAARAMWEVRATVTAGARQALADIELALYRLDTGRYGRCRRCDRDIAPAVLTAIPSTTRCLDCQYSQRAADQPAQQRGRDVRAGNR